MKGCTDEVKNVKDAMGRGLVDIAKNVGNNELVEFLKEQGL
jgi:hypothetical protein